MESSEQNSDNYEQIEIKCGTETLVFEDRTSTLLGATKDDILRNLSLIGTYDQQYIAALLDLKRLLKENMKLIVCCTNNIGFYSKYQFYFIVEMKETISWFPGIIKMIFNNHDLHAVKFEFFFDKDARLAKLWAQTECNMTSVQSQGVKSSPFFTIEEVLTTSIPLFGPEMMSRAIYNFKMIVDQKIKKRKSEMERNHVDTPGLKRVDAERHFELTHILAQIRVQNLWSDEAILKRDDRSNSAPPRFCYFIPSLRSTLFAARSETER
ncbi:unnamed protein product [Oikopleura dioica]|uniref:Uncharacterized protein n=1 Tax=Oikopleura dioica TaxID=34765 RepID=E4WXU9_OIKDI|nr:unnamed protein product [Oikopleura dioica]